MIDNLTINKIQYTTKNGIDLVIIGDGFTEAQQDLYHQKVFEAIDGIFRLEPYVGLKDKFNIYSIPTISNESGISTIDHPNNPTTEIIVDNFLGSYRNKGGLIRLTDFTKKPELLQYLKTKFKKNIFLVVICNASPYGGSGEFPDNTMMPTTHVMLDNQYGTFKELVAHEFGHSFAGLADEYGGDCTGGGVEDFNETLYDRGNVTKDIVNDRKWDYLENPQYIAGANYCDTDWYRSTQSSIMRSWFESGTILDEQFNQVSIDIIEKRVREELEYNSNLVTYLKSTNLIGKAPEGNPNFRFHGDVIEIKTSICCNDFYIAPESQVIISKGVTVKVKTFTNQGTLINNGKMKFV